MLAVARGEIQMIELILKNKNIDINAKDEYSGISSIWLACLYGQGDIVSMLADAGADIFVSNRNKMDLLHLAVYNNHIQIVGMLLKSGFPLSNATDTGLTPLQIAAKLGLMSLFEVILTSISESDMKKPMQREMISRLNTETSMSALSTSILMENYEIAKILIEHGADSFYPGTDIQRDLSPVFIACEKENILLLESMCDHGAKLNV